nr:MAG TPA: hypothetical protein [Caudoviricetes sp.]
MDCCWVMVQIRINCHVRRKPTGSIPVQFYFSLLQENVYQKVCLLYTSQKDNTC